jgi:hypothetical protein
VAESLPVSCRTWQVLRCGEHAFGCARSAPTVPGYTNQPKSAECLNLVGEGGLICSILQIRPPHKAVPSPERRKEQPAGKPNPDTKIGVAGGLGGCAGVTPAICQTNFALDYCIPTAARESEPQVPTRTPLSNASPLDRSGLWSPKDENQTSWSGGIYVRHIYRPIEKANTRS